MTVVRDRKIRTALRTNQIAEFVTVTAWKKIRGVITLIPKEDGSLLDLSNLRPITLLNVDCKIATKAIAKRLGASLPKLINHDQTGFIKGRYIGKNIRLIIDTMEFTKAHNIAGILVSLDFFSCYP